MSENNKDNDEEETYDVNDHVIFKIEDSDPEECAKILKIEKNGDMDVKQYMGGMVIQGTIKKSNIIRKPTKEDYKTVRGSQAYELYRRRQPHYRNMGIVGFESNITRDRDKN
tara:strand:+ start:22 stop:357 length:336 start_codon:yes stop_codon:yes gene_type:complete